MTNLKPVKKIRPFTKFCMTIGNLPSSYLESMTYYEQLLWFIKFLEETVIPTVNNNGEAVEELQQNVIEFENSTIERQTNYETNLTNLFNELHSFVDNYFENLDVQEEINNKLDDMVEHGILQEIVANYLNSNAIFAFDNVQSMINSTNLINGSFAQTLGFYNKNDNGKALYKIRNINVDDVVDNMTILQMNNENLIAELINEDFINIDSLGAIGNGVADDTNIVIKAINLAQEKNKTLIGHKQYLLSSQIDMSNINCDLKNATFKTSYGVKILNTQKRIYTLPTIISQNESENSGLILENCNDCVFNITQIGNFHYGLHMIGDNSTGVSGLGGSCCYNKIYTQLITSCLESMFLEHKGTGYVNENIFIGGHLFNSQPYVASHENIIKVHLKGNGSGVCDTNLFLKVCLEGGDNSTSYKTYLENTDNTMFLNCRFEGISPNHPQFYCANTAYRTQIIGGYYLSMDFPNKKPEIILGENNYSLTGQGITDNPTLTLKNAAGFEYSVIDIINGNNNRRTTKIYPSKLEVINPVADNEFKYAMTQNGITFTDKNGNSRNALKADSSNTFIHTPDYQHAFVIGHDITYFTAGIHLWEYNGHLYGKYGKPTSATDGTMIL